MNHILRLRSALLCIVTCFAVGTLAAQDAGPLAPLAPAPTQGPSFLANTATPKPTEDWTALRVDPAALGPISSANLGTAELPDFTREILRVQWRSGDPIDLYVLKPRGVANPPVVLYLYGYPTDSDRFRDDGWGKRATQGGFAAVGFVSALTGQRFANRPMKEWFVSELQEVLGTSTHDVQMILNYLAMRGDLNVNHVGMIGQGSGGAIAVLAAAADPRITVLDLLDPWGDWPDWLKLAPLANADERASYLTPEFLSRVARLDPVLYLPTLNLKALRVEQVMDEPITPFVAKQKIAAATPATSVVQYPNESAHRDAWRTSGLSGWVHDQLKPSVPGTTATTATTATSSSATPPGQSPPPPSPPMQ
jgi:hypothetical protein